jgi:hypothetical protein
MGNDNSGRVFHLWREYADPPFVRWAADLIEDPSVPSGHRVLSHDYAVGDDVFMARIERTLNQAIEARDSEEDEDGAIRELSKVLDPGQPGHFEAAMHRVPGTVLRPTGRV